MSKKPPLTQIKSFYFNKKVGNSYSNDEFNFWVVEALQSLQKNIAVIYHLLPEKETVRKIEPLLVDLKICDNCKKHDFEGTGTCACHCHNPHITVSPNSSWGTSYVTPPTTTSHLSTN